MVHQVSQALTELNRIGQSKKEAKKKHDFGIHSIKQVKETLSASQNFVKWVRNQFGVLSVYDLNEVHYRTYMAYLTDMGRSTGHRQNVETSLRHLQKGMGIRSQRFGYETTLFVPEKRITNWRELKKAENRSYTHDEFEKMLPFLSTNVRDAVLLQRYMGLRVREACHVLVKHFSFSEGLLHIPQEEAKGITKGGRYRMTPIQDHFIDVIQRLVKDKSDYDRLILIETSTVRKGVNRACKKADIVQDGRGTHGFRHLYCRERLTDLLAAECIGTDGRTMLERVMTNRDAGRKADYSILSAHEKEIYRKLKKVIDTIHEEIGHGEDRWDLAERYIR